jgi:hypothetical protein
VPIPLVLDPCELRVAVSGPVTGKGYDWPFALICIRQAGPIRLAHNCPYVGMNPHGSLLLSTKIS